MSLSRLCLLMLLGLTLAVPTFAQTLPLPLETLPNKTFADVKTQAAAESTGGPTWGNAPDPKTLPVHQTFTGTVTADATMNKLAIFSDDGADVFVDGTKVWSSKDKGQALPDITNSLHELPVTLSAGSHSVQIDYSNIIYTVADAAKGIPPDIDGCTLFMYGPSTVPTVTVTISDLGDVSVGVPASSAATAFVSPLPGGYSASQLAATWSYSTAYLVYSATGNDETWGDPGDGSSAAVTLNGAATSPDGTFTAMLNTEGYYEACIAATVRFHNPTTGENFGPYTGYGFAGNGGGTASAAASTPGKPTSANLMPHGVPAGSPPANASHPKVLAKGPAPTLSITGLSDTAKLNPGGLVVLNVASEGNSSPPQKIVLGVTHGKVGQNLTVTFNVAQNGSGVVRVYDPDAKINLTFNGTDNVFSVKPEAPKTLYVLGLGSGSVGTGITGYSSSMGDVVLTAKAGNHTDKASMTVLWVDTPNFAQKDSLPTDNLPSELADHRMGWSEVVAAKVYPSQFSYPNESGYYDNTTSYSSLGNDARLHLSRDVNLTLWLKKNGVYSIIASATWLSSPYGNGQDTSDYPGRHDLPSANNGKIDDTDAPGLFETSQPPNTIERARYNFRSFAVVTLPSQQSTPIRCSPIMGYFVRFSMQNSSGGQPANNNTWHLINPPDIGSDLKLDLGTTPVTSDLR